MSAEQDARAAQARIDAAVENARAVGTIDVLARQNMTLQGQLIPVYEVATLSLTPEVEACIANQALVPRDPTTGDFVDLGPVWPIPNPPGVRCCGR